MKLAAIVTTYYPVVSELTINISSYINHVDALIVWINTPEKDQNQFTIEIPDHAGKILFMTTGKNIGIASALNKGVQWAIENNFTHLLTLDQDSYFGNGQFQKYKTLVNQYQGKHVGTFGINLFDGNKLAYQTSNASLEVVDTITSGSIFPMQTFKICGFFDDGLFIDAVDFEYCYRIKKYFNLRTVVFPEIVLNHKIGYVSKSILGYRTENYSAFRTYFIIRNQINIWIRYPEYFSLKRKISLIRNYIVLRFIKTILSENNKFLKCKAITIGVIHGLKGKTGFYEV